MRMQMMATLATVAPAMMAVLFELELLPPVLSLAAEVVAAAVSVLDAVEGAVPEAAAEAIVEDENVVDADADDDVLVELEDVVKVSEPLRLETKAKRLPRPSR